ncbi:long-chain-fatty-acid--CoA ligase [Paraburkholderia sp. NMBU_R16]|uniref:acyl-CoA synthetase n=1 Tax=Paraburkholderia sp. NMBU_R16 TaxID=2698676 RepID=UPI00156549DC|nr:long-chain fatty acid--CoA ligase [Paraburkholderia sp. NMBU_R16]NRO99006.1 long-chain-fatty-acid--CoA ligase [Paraburkholderia sp. NMBU_R16]
MYLTQILRRSLTLAPEKIATISGKRRLTHEQLASRVTRLAGALRRLGVNPGDRVAMLSLNSDRYLEYYFAVWWAGGVVNPINVRWTAAEIAYSLDDCDTNTLIIDDTFMPILDEIKGRARSLRNIVHASDSEHAPDTLSYEDLVSNEPPLPDSNRGGDDLAGIFYTGGTTGRPKGVMLTHQGLMTNALTLSAEGLAPAGSVGLHVAPMFHLADGAFMLAMSLRQGTHVFLPAFDAKRALETIRDERITTIALVPTMIARIADRFNEFPAQDLNSLTQLFYAGSPVSSALLERVKAVLPSIGLMQAYGLTEMSPVISILGPEQHSPARLASAGFPTLHVGARIVDPTGEEVRRGDIGEIVARGCGMMTGYWNRSDETQRAIRDGWLHTGDAGYMDDSGCIFVVDRLKDMIITGGENVYSTEVENALSAHTAVSACAVIGIPSADWGEEVHAVVVPRSGHYVDEAMLREHCRSLIATYKCPRSIEFRDALPISGAGKVLKERIRAPFWKDRERNVA